MGTHIYIYVWERGAVAFRPQGRRWERDWVGPPDGEPDEQIPGDPAILPGGNASYWLSGRVLLAFLEWPPPPQRLHPGGVTYGI